MRARAFSLLMAAAGCAPVDRPGPALTAGIGKCARVEAYRDIGVVTAGEPVAPGFTVLGRVEARYDQTRVGRIEALQQQACELGGDAVIKVSEGPGARSPFEPDLPEESPSPRAARVAGDGTVIARGYAVTYPARHPAPLTAGSPGSMSSGPGANLGVR